METALNSSKVLARFDKLVASGAVSYDEDQKIERMDVEGFQIEFRVTQALNKKPSISSPSAKESAGRKEDKKIPPGSDIDVAGLEVTTIGETHLLTFNKFSVYRPHLLLLTQDGYRRQWEALDLEDFVAAHRLLMSFDSDLLVFFNCRPEGGCSRLHKHMQAVSIDSFDLCKNLNETGQMNTPFQYAMSESSSLPSPDALFATYTKLLQQVSGDTGQPCADPKSAPAHNMLLDKHGMVVIPRRHGDLEGLGVNACGMLGMFWVNDEERKQRYVELGPLNVIAHAGWPPSQNNEKMANTHEPPIH